MLRRFDVTGFTGHLGQELPLYLLLLRIRLSSSLVRHLRTGDTTVLLRNVRSNGSRTGRSVNEDGVNDGAATMLMLLLHWNECLAMVDICSTVWMMVDMLLVGHLALTDEMLMLLLLHDQRGADVGWRWNRVGSRSVEGGKLRWWWKGVAPAGHDAALICREPTPDLTECRRA
jgi:hypothetical protein